MSRNNSTQPGARRGCNMRFGTPQTFRLTVSGTPPTTVYLPKPTSGELLTPPTQDEILRSRLQCFPNESQFIDNWGHPLPAGNYQVRYIPIQGEESDDEEIMDMDSNAILGHNPEMEMELGMQCDSTKASAMATPFPQNSAPPPAPPGPPTPDDNNGLVNPPSLPPLKSDMILGCDIILSQLGEEESVVKEGDHNLKKKDLEVLKRDEWLDDDVVNYYIHLIASRSRKKGNPEAFATVYGFSASFYALLGSASGLEKVAQSADGDNIFDSNLILFPVCISHHWILVAADTRTMTITAYNSMSHKPVKQVLNNIQRYLENEYRRLNKGNDPKKEWALVTNEENPDIPQQGNGIDCGVFILQFAEYLSRDQPFDFGQANMLYFRAKTLYECITVQLISN